MEGHSTENVACYTDAAGMQEYVDATRGTPSPKDVRFRTLHLTGP